MLVSSGTASSNQAPDDADTAVLLEALADAGDALTAALVTHDLDGVAAATRDAEALVDRLGGARAASARRAPRRAAQLALLVARIGATARRNAVLLESAWATDAAILRLLASAAREADPGASYAGPAAPAAPAGWLDRSA